MIGTAYYPDYYPKADWSIDLDRMVNAGISVVRILEFAWCWYQPTPDHFEWDGLDHFLSLCEERNLEVCICTPTATPPPWFFQRYPDCRLVDTKGNPCFSHRHMVSWNHPDALAEAFNTIEQLVSRYGEHPVVTRWQIDNEPNYAEKVDVVYDFNPYALQDAREWLKKKYQTLDALNEAWFGAFWSQAHNDWEQIWETHSPLVNPQSCLDFQRWRQHTVAEFVHSQADLLRRHAPSASIGTNIPEVGIHFSTCIAQDYWAQAANLDWVGTDLYAATADREQDLAALRYSCDLMRSASGEARFLIAETQGGAHERTWKAGFAAEGWSADYLQQCCEVYAERGAEEIWAFMWRPTLAGQEMGMNGVQDLDGNDTDRTRLLKSYASEPSFLTAKHDAYRQRSRALIHYSQDTIRFAAFFGQDQLQHLQQSMTGVHRELDLETWQINFFRDEDLRRDQLGDAELLVLPETHLMSDELINTLIKWSEMHPTSTLIIGPHTGLLDERGHLRPPSRRLLQRYLGVTFGHLQDISVHAELEGEVLSCFREMDPGENRVVQQLTWKGKSYPACIQCGNFNVVSHPWGLHSAVHAAHALPVTS